MARRVLGILIAVALAAAGTFFILNYVRNIDARAQEGQELIDVYLVTSRIPAGTPASQLSQFVQQDTLPSQYQIPGQIDDLADLDGLVADVDLLPGDMLSIVKFVDIEDFTSTQFETVAVPNGLLEVTLQLTEERLLGGQVRPGDTVAFVASFAAEEVNPNFVDPSIEVTFVEPEIDPATGELVEIDPDEAVLVPNLTHLILHKLLVTNLQYAVPPVLVDEEGNPIPQDPRTAANTTLFVTIAATAAEVEQIVFVKEFGLVYLAREPENAIETGTDIITRGNIFR